MGRTCTPVFLATLGLLDAAVVRFLAESLDEDMMAFSLNTTNHSTQTRKVDWPLSLASAMRISTPQLGLTSPFGESSRGESHVFSRALEG